MRCAHQFSEWKRVRNEEKRKEYMERKCQKCTHTELVTLSKFNRKKEAKWDEIANKSEAEYQIERYIDRMLRW